MTAEDIMTENVTTVEESATLADALEVLSELEVRHLPVVRKGEVIGMISDRDFRSLGLDLVSDLENRDRLQARLQTSVANLMSGDVLSVDRSTDVQEVIDLLVEEKVGAIPVVEGDSNELVGIVSYMDVLRAARELFV
ncbi:MAG: CBS domain-containing protein [Myxococcota bacterium]